MIEFLRGKVTAKDWLAVGIILGVTAGIFFVFVFVLHRGQIDELERTRGEAEAMELQLRSARDIQAKFGELEQELEKIQALVADFERRLPTGREIRELVTKFEQLANEAGLRVEMLPRARIVDARKETIPYQVTAYGDFHQISGFINRLERYERYLKVSDLKIEKQQQGVSKATFTLSTYTFIEERPGAAQQPQATARADS